LVQPGIAAQRAGVSGEERRLRRKRRTKGRAGGDPLASHTYALSS